MTKNELKHKNDKKMLNDHISVSRMMSLSYVCVYSEDEWVDTYLWYEPSFTDDII